MKKEIIIGVLAVGLAGTAIYGYQEHQKNEALLTAAENTYQRSFHDLSYQMDVLNDKIGTTLAMNSRKSLSPALSDVWRMAYEAQHLVGMLPLSTVELTKTEEFLSDIGKFSHLSAVRDLEKEPLTKKEYERLKQLYAQSGEIQQELRSIQAKVMSDDLRWADLETALADGNEPKDNTIIDGLSTVEKKVTGYSEASQLNPTHVSHKETDQRYRTIQGKTISKQQAIEIARKYAGFGMKAAATVQENGTGSDFPFYSVTVTDPKSDSKFVIDITKVAGYPIIFMNNRPIGKAELSLNDAAGKAEEFLKENKYSSMELYESSQYDSTGVFNFVYVENGVRVYTDSIKIKVALDNGSIIGFSAADYVKTNKTRNLGEPSITKEEAKKKINPKVNIMEDRLAVIMDQNGKEILCYEFMGVLDDETYRIFINAANGDEELVEKLADNELSATSF